MLHEKHITVHAPPTALYSHSAAFRFPDLMATSLAGEDVAIGAATGRLFAGRWTLMGLAGSNFAQSMVDGWLTGVVPDEAERPSDAPPANGPPPLQTRWLSLVEGAVYGWLRRPLLASMRHGVPPERQARVLCRFDDDVSDLRRSLQMSNRYLGYVCLVDPQGSVRWHTHGNEVPTAADVAALSALVEKAMRFETPGPAASNAPKKGGKSSKRSS